MKILYLLIGLFFISQNIFSQKEDNFLFMGMDREIILGSEFKKYERIYTGDYNQIGYAIDDETAYWFYFNENNKCKMVIIQKNLEYYDRALLILGSEFPKKKKGDKYYFFWNSRMMATLAKEEDYINIAYQIVFPELLEL